MKELKFRVWDKSHDKYLDYMRPHEWVGPNDDLYKLLNHDRFIFQQFVGIKDKNGREIYEGDFLSRYDGEEIVLIEFSSEYAKFGGLIYLQDGEVPENDSWYWFDDQLAHVSEIIGNTFENPEI